MAKKNKVKKGDLVKVIIEVWQDGETPTVRNFYTGKIVKIVARAENCFYVTPTWID